MFVSAQSRHNTFMAVGQASKSVLCLFKPNLGEVCMWHISGGGSRGMQGAATPRHVNHADRLKARPLPGQAFAQNISRFEPQHEICPAGRWEMCG